jgi:hypothetical protein
VSAGIGALTGSRLVAAIGVLAYNGAHNPHAEHLKNYYM